MSYKKVLGMLSGSALLAFATPAHAVVLDFTLTGDYTASWQLDSSPVVSGDSADGFVVWNVLGSFPGATFPYTSDISFYFASALGGLSIDDPFVDPTGDPVNLLAADGPQLFTGTATNPTFSLGTFALTENGGRGTYSLTIAAAPPAVPEPATWAMMVLGFGAIGVAMRAKTRRRVNFNFA